MAECERQCASAWCNNRKIKSQVCQSTQWWEAVDGIASYQTVHQSSNIRWQQTLAGFPSAFWSLRRDKRLEVHPEGIVFGCFSSRKCTRCPRKFTKRIQPRLVWRERMRRGLHPESNRAVPSTDAWALSKSWRVSSRARSSHCRLANLAYPYAPTEIRETLSKDQFVDALQNYEMRICIKKARVKYLNDAIQLAGELEAYNRTEKSNYARPSTSETTL